jgi:hypothetical protein
MDDELQLTVVVAFTPVAIVAKMDGSSPRRRWGNVCNV